MSPEKEGVNRRAFLSASGAAAASVRFPVQAAAQKTGVVYQTQDHDAGELHLDTVCPWTAENPRHDHQQILPLSEDRLLLVWSEYYVAKPSRIYRTAYATSRIGDVEPCRISARVSRDRGRSWSGKITIQENFGADNVKHPNLLRLPSGEILFTFTVRDMARRDLKIFMKRSKDDCETWSRPVQISPPGGVYFTNADHSLRHSSGRLILPCHWGEFYGPGDHYKAFCLYSDDEGETWQTSRKKIDLPRRGAEEPAVVELQDGSLLAMMRTTLGKVYRSLSSDRGETWSDAEPTELPSPSSANCIKRIPKTGDLVFIWNNSTPFALSQSGSTSYHHPRDPLTAAISKDEGRTWTHFKDIERRQGYTSGYPSLTFVGNEALVTYYHASRSMSRDTELRLKILHVNWFYS